MNTNRPLALLLEPIFLELMDGYSYKIINIHTCPLTTKDI